MQLYMHTDWPGVYLTHVHRLRLAIQVLVLDVRDLRLKRDSAKTCSKEKKRVTNTIKRKMTKIREAVAELAIWRALGTNQPAEQLKVTQEQLDSMLKGQPAPWDVDGATGVEGSKLFYGRKFHLVMSEQDRCNEQIHILRIERGRLLAWLQCQIQICTDACATAPPAKDISTVGTAAEAWEVFGAHKPEHGRLYFIRQHWEWCSDATKTVQAFAWA